MKFLEDIDIERVKKVVPVNYAMLTKSIEPYLEPTADKFIIPHIGKQLFDSVVQLYDDNADDLTQLTEFQLLMLKKVEAALYNYAMYMALPFINTQVSSAGITQQHTQNSKPAFGHAIAKLDFRLTDSAYDGIEFLIEFCEDNIVGLTDYASSEAHLNNRSTFIYSAKQFEECYPIQKRWQTFRTLLPAIKDVETFVIKRNIGKPYFDELKEKILENTLTENDENALNLIRNIVANFAIAKGLKQNWVSLFSDAVVFSEYASNSDNVEVKKSGTAIQVSTKITDATDTGQQYMVELIKLLNDHPDEYPTYKTWYDEQHPTVQEPENLDTRIFESDFESDIRGIEFPRAKKGMIW